MKFTWCVIHNRRAQGLKRAMLSAACLPLIGTNLLAQEMANLPEALIEKIEIAKKACSDFEDGQFAMEGGSILRVDLDGDLNSDWVLNEAGFSCSSAASLYCGTGGCMSHFAIDSSSDVHSMLNRGWNAKTLGPHVVVLADVHGSQCGGINPTPCVSASVWDADAGIWRTTSAIWE